MTTNRGTRNSAEAEALDGIVYSCSDVGHRRSYTNIFVRETGFRGVIEAPSPGVFLTLFGTGRLLMTTFEESPVFGFLLSLTRGLVGRRTVVIVMNPARVLRGGRFVHIVKGAVLRVLRRAPRVRTLSIIPTYVDDRLEAFSTDWIFDPQFWDLDPESKGGHVRDLSEVFSRLTSGRRMLLYLGRASRIKGFDFLVEFLESADWAGKGWVFVAAGASQPGMETLLERFEAAGGQRIDRYLTEAEVIALKREASCLWAIYNESYDSSSGIVGRALQLAKPVLVRQGAIIESIGRAEGGLVLPVAWGDVVSAGRQLDGLPTEDPGADERTRRMRLLSVKRIRRALSLTT